MFRWTTKRQTFPSENMQSETSASLTASFADSYGWRVGSFKVMLVGTTALGGFVGYRLAEIRNLQLYKLLNIVGLCCSLLAIVVLSEVLVSIPRWKKVCVQWLAPSLLWANVTIPLGVFAGAGTAWLMKREHSAAIVARFGFYALGYGGVVGSFLEQTVVVPKLQALKNIELRWRVLGLILLLTGIVLQLVAAFQDL